MDLCAAGRDRPHLAPEMHPDDSAPPIVRLRPVEPGDLRELFAFQRDPEANRMAAFGAADPSDRAAFDARWARIRADPEVLVRTIEVRRGDGVGGADGGRDAGEVAGSILLWRDEGLDAPEVSYWLGRGYWGRGIATAALRAFLDIVTQRPLYGRAASTNPASRRVLERSGFRLVRVDAGVPATDGRLVDEAILRLDASLPAPPAA